MLYFFTGYERHLAEQQNKHESQRETRRTTARCSRCTDGAVFVGTARRRRTNGAVLMARSESAHGAPTPANMFTTERLLMVLLVG